MTKRKRSNPLKKRGFKRGGSKEKRFFIKIPQKNKEFKNKESSKKGFKKNPLKKEAPKKIKSSKTKEFKTKSSKNKPPPKKRVKKGGSTKS
ncbi:hypothetical protein BB389_07470 [Helicobacter pylori]|nr:hypothetical protein BB389_07470 [Helicobacter pylori]